jgi:ERCC4-related helicase/ERCC4-type nuclease
MPSVVHPRLKEGVEARAYQLDALKTVLSGSTLMVMPTGFGKSAVQWMAIASHLESGGRILVVAPTVALLDQHQRMILRHLKVAPDEVVIYTGTTPPAKRPALWVQGRVVLATAQVVRNDAINGAVDLSGLTLVVLDEAHHATGSHAYVEVAQLVQRHVPKATVLGATASPGASERAIRDVQSHLGTLLWSIHERAHPLLEPYAVDLSLATERLTMPAALNDLIAPLALEEDGLAERLRRQGFLADVGHLTASMLDEAQRRASSAIARQDRRGYDAARSIADLRRLHLLVDLLRCQGMGVAHAFLLRQEEGGHGRKRGDTGLLARPAVRSLMESLVATEELHPKPAAVERLLKQRVQQAPEGRCLVFTEYRDTVELLVERLSQVEGLRPQPFVGQSGTGDRRGMSQAEQVERIRAFREGEANVLIATSVGEEGLDIPSADLVVFYEPVASAIRAIQRRGRTGRHNEGEVVMLLAEGTRDEHMLRASAARERRMLEHLERIRRSRSVFEGPLNPTGLEQFEVEHEGVRMEVQTFIDHERQRLAPIETPPSPPVADPPAPASSARPEGVVRPEERRGAGQLGLYDFAAPSEDIVQVDARPQPLERSAVPVLDGTSALAVDAERRIEVILDRREASSTLASGLRVHGVTPVFRHLVTGDVRIGPRVLLERKTSRDLHDSIRDGRLLAQARRLSAAAPCPGLLLETGHGYEGATHPQAVLGAIAWMAFDLGLSVICVRNASESAALLAMAAQREQAWLDALVPAQAPRAHDEVHASLMAARAELDAIDDRPGPLARRWEAEARQQRLVLIEAIEGIGPVTSRALAEAFGSIAEVAAASEAELAAVDGIGPGRAAEVRRALHG